MIVAPDEIYTTPEAAEFLRKSERQVQRYLKDGRLKAQWRNGRWQITALSLWKFQGIEQEMQSIWVDYCVRMSENDGE
ncbi:helix-turn-helix domain-containing protein [Lutimaribacter marinistellae]|uniref:Helix-turn-helix domain-containing protein n=1 Tax=Lutimaribacter marinistellae TaxID=1820329 RepID=A0ABV7TQ84_9RHOB